jgi:hypothetical protein
MIFLGEKDFFTKMLNHFKDINVSSGREKKEIVNGQVAEGFYSLCFCGKRTG